MPDVRLFLLGMPRIEYKGETVKLIRRKGFALAAYLALNRQPQSRDIVASLLWPELDDAHARSSLRSTLRALTAIVPVEWIHADRMTLGLKQDAVWVDTHAFEALLTQRSAHEHSLESMCSGCALLYKEAAELYQADFMAGYHAGSSAEYEEWQRTQREWLSREYADVHRRLSRYYADEQDYDEAIKHAREWLAVDPLHEPAHRQLMSLFTANGQRGDALNQYKRCVSILDMELASPPQNETTLLYEAILGNQSAERIDYADARATFGIMPHLPSMVVGRESVLEDIKRRVGIGSAEKRPVTVIQGWPGVGKSTTAAMIAHDHEIARQFPDGILWASLGEEPSLLSELSTWAAALGLGDIGRAVQLEDISSQLTAVMRDKRVLLIVDDVWKTEHAQPFRVGGHLCALLMTTRLNDVAVALAPSTIDVYHLPILSEAAAVDLLARLAPETVAQYPEEANALVVDLEGLPLAIHVAGRLLHSEARLGWGIKELLAELRTGGGLLDAPTPSDMLGVSPHTFPTVAALLKRSTDSLEAEVRRRFAYLGFFVPKPATFDIEAIAIAWGEPDPRRFVRQLVNHGLLEPIGGGRFQMHALLAIHARSLLEQGLMS